MANLDPKVYLPPAVLCLLKKKYIPETESPTSQKEEPENLERNSIMEEKLKQFVKQNGDVEKANEFLNFLNFSDEEMEEIDKDTMEMEIMA